MIDKSRAAAPDADSASEPGKNRRLAILTDFAAVPRHYNRHDGWTEERQRGFIAALADTGSVKSAAHAVNMTPEGAYQLRRHPAAQQFRKAWEAALALGVQRLEDVAMERALHGIEVPVYHFGEIIGTRRVHNDRLLMFLLRNRAPKRFAADSWQKTGAATRGQLDRLRKKWREEWEAERNDPVEIEKIRAGIARKFEKKREEVLDRRARELAEASDRTRELHAAYQRSLAEDTAAREQGLLPGAAVAAGNGAEREEE